MLNWFRRKPVSVEPIAIDRKPKIPIDGVQDPEVQRKLDAILGIMEANPGGVAWEDLKPIREELQELLSSPGISEHDFLLVYQVWTGFMDDLRVGAAAHSAAAAAQLEHARLNSETRIDFMHYVGNPMLAMSDKEAAIFASDGYTADGRRVWPLLEQHMPETAEKIRLTRLDDPASAGDP